MSRSHYVLRLKVPDELREMYIAAANSHNNMLVHQNAGFDLFCPADVKVYGHSTEKIDQGVKGAMEFVEVQNNNNINNNININNLNAPVGYFMYPRSSTGSKTPLRLANSVGVIDSGYRGNYIAVFDNGRENSFIVERLQRLVQICPPNLSYPMKVLIVNDLDMETARGEGGFGSTGF
jgi:dUTP pyrophosphatase